MSQLPTRMMSPFCTALSGTIGVLVTQDRIGKRHVPECLKIFLFFGLIIGNNDTLLSHLVIFKTVNL